MTTYNRPRAMSEMLPALTKDVFGRKSMLFGKMMAGWADVAGAEIAAKTTPLDLKFQKRPEGTKGGGQAVLHLAVQPAFALEFSYQKNLLIERLNMFFGYGAIKDIKIVQNSEVMRSKEKKPRPRTKPLPLPESQKIDKMVSGIEGDELGDALKSLGKAIAARKDS